MFLQLSSVGTRHRVQTLALLPVAEQLSPRPALLLLCGSLPFSFPGFPLPTKLLQTYLLLLKILVLISVEAMKTEDPHERKVRVVIGIPVVSLLPLGQRLLTEQFHHFHGLGVGGPGNFSKQPGTQPRHAQGIF